MSLSIDPESESTQKYQTVDNLNPKAYERYIADTSLLNEEEVQQVIKTPNVAAKAEVLTTTPKHPEIDILLKLLQRDSSPFTEPPGFVLTNNVFTHSLIPSIGSIEELIKKLEPLKVKNDSVVKKQLEILEGFGRVLGTLDEILKIIKRKENEFQKG